MRVVLTDCDHGFVDPERAAVEAAGGELLVAACTTEDDVIEAASGADAIITQAAPVTARVIEALADCRVIGRYGTGLDTVDVAAAHAAGRTVVHTPGFCTVEVADHALALILSLGRRIPSTTLGPANAAILENYPARIQQLRGVVPMSEATCGIVGLGRIGREVARRLDALGSRVLGYDPHLDPSAELAGIELTTLDELLAASDFLTLHVPMTTETRRMIGAEQLALMKQSACVVNVSRGDLVDEDALGEALAGARLAGAALDVTAEEPTPVDHPLLRFSNVIVTPHVAFYSDASLQDVKHRIASYVMNALRGEGEYVSAPRA